MKRLILIAAVLLVMGAGCKSEGIAGFLGSKISLPKLPFGATAGDPDAAALAVRAEQGTTFRIRPTFLGVTGTVNDLIGSEEGLRLAVVETRGADAESLRWTEGARSGSIAASKTAASDSMFLPAFWKDGETKLARESTVWLSPKAYAELTGSGKAEWRIGLAGTELGTVAAAIKNFNALASKLSASATATAASPFQLAATGEAVIPLKVGGKVENVRALRAANWLADYLILKNPENPLILKVNINPLALGALDAFKALGVDPTKVGYEVVGVEPPEESSAGGLR